MEKESISFFRRCPNCGKLYTPEQSRDDHCSQACTERYESCLTCGRYFPVGTGMSAGICSDECSMVFVVVTGDKDMYILAEETV